MEAECLAGAKVIYSLWHGYLERDGNSTETWCREHGVGFEQLHTSGHASRLDLMRFVRRLKPRKVVPIHTFEPERFRDFCDRVVVVEDGAELAV